MNYELAKQLKEAGFPQVEKPEERLRTSGINLQMGSKGEPAYVPTLSELIEACGEEFRELRRHRNRKYEPWGAVSLALFFIQFGKTPTEAVAKLYLALHEK